MHVNKLHANIGHTGAERMRTTSSNLHLIIKGVLKVYEDCDTENITQKFLQKVAEERDLNPEIIIYLDIST